MKYLTLLLSLCSLGTGLWAAYKWLKASGVEVPQGLPQFGMNWGNIDRRMGATMRLPEAIEAEIRETNETAMALIAMAISARLNKQAAVWTAASIAFSSLATVVGLAAAQILP
jgi:hypothetical protein